MAACGPHNSGSRRKSPEGGIFLQTQLLQGSLQGGPPFFSDGITLVGDVFLSDSLMLTAHCPCPFSLCTKLPITLLSHPVK